MMWLIKDPTKGLPLWLEMSSKCENPKVLSQGEVPMWYKDVRMAQGSKRERGRKDIEATVLKLSVWWGLTCVDQFLPFLRPRDEDFAMCLDARNDSGEAMKGRQIPLPDPLASSSYR
jgi:hypothetical protein